MVYVYIDNEIDEPHRSGIAQHLGECPPFGQQFVVEETIKARVRLSCSQQAAPEGLRSQIVAWLHQTTITYRSE